MTEIQEPIELTLDELQVVSGGRHHVVVGIAQFSSNSNMVEQVGGSLSIGGGKGSVTVASGVTFDQSSSNTTVQSSSNSNTGSVVAVV